MRYEGMHEILDGLRERLRQETFEAAPARAAVVDQVVTMKEVASARDRLKSLLGEAQELRKQLSVDGVRKLSPREQDEALGLLSEVLHELWRCEATLQGVAPID